MTFEEVYEKWLKEQERKLKVSSMLNKKSKFSKHILPNSQNSISTRSRQEIAIVSLTSLRQK
ncbi:hypothetical protein [Gracilibacillus saliphilus]|uniref:hypothetical protein n=1 Tax=Gracilibacillus saliphilus TaxID=543890 RepID=UPI003B52F8B7